MGEPTLFKKGNLIEHVGSEPKSILDEIRPIDYIMDWIKSRIGKPGNSVADRVLIIQSSTGSGKSTIIPPEFYHRFFSIDNRNIVCTQPRVLTSIEIPKTIIPFHTREMLDKSGFQNRTPLILGDNIGFQNGMIVKKPTRGIIYMTIGVLQQQLAVMTPEDFISKYSLIVIDEVHERSIGTDMTLFLMKKLISEHFKNKNCPFLLITSATFNPEKFAKYMLFHRDFHQPVGEKIGEKYSRNIVKVSGFTFPIEDKWATYDADNYIQEIINHVINIHKTNSDDFMDPKTVIQNLNSDKLLLEEDAINDIVKKQKFRDILVFVSGEGDAKKIIKKIELINNTDSYFKSYPVILIKLMRVDVNTRSENYQSITIPYEKLGVSIKEDDKLSIKHPVRRVIISTNVAETGITIESLKYVIDSGYLFSTEYNPAYRCNMLILRPVTKGMAKQRRGRVGRKAPGIVYPIYTKDTFDNLQEDQYPDIIREDICLDIMRLIVISCNDGRIQSESLKSLIDDKDFIQTISEAEIDLYKIDLLDLPSADSMADALDRLFILGAINSNCTPTMFGIIMSRFRFIKPESIKMIMSGYSWGVSILDLITIAAFTSFPKRMIFVEDVPKYFGNIHWSRRELMYSCDFIKMLLIWNDYILNIQNKDFEQWCSEMSIVSKQFIEIIDIREEIIQTIASIGFNPYQNHEKSLNTVLNTNEYIINLKQCIYEGYKQNIAKWDGTSYQTNIGRISIHPDRLYLSNNNEIQNYKTPNPRYLMYNNLSLKRDSKTNMYLGEVEYISVIDGYISISN